jgi:hypothetical protein
MRGVATFAQQPDEALRLMESAAIVYAHSVDLN